LKYAQTGPQQVAAQSARAKQALAQVAAGAGAARPGQAQPELHQDRGSTAGIITRKSVEINQNVAPGQNLLTLVSLEGSVGHGQLQGDPAQAHVRRAACRD
jgi:membrane fusion protein (multidrug efflux system)